MKLISRSAKFYNNHVSQQVVSEFEEIIMQSGASVSRVFNEGLVLPFLYKFLVIKAGLNISRFCTRQTESTFAIHMGPDYGRSLPLFSRHDHNYAYFFDLWPRHHQSVQQFMDKGNLTKAFFSTYHATKRCRDMGYSNVYWVPEGINPAHYTTVPNQHKDIDVLELGRKHATIHQQIKVALSQGQKVHLYEKEAGKVIFTSQSDFVKGLARSKISICIPTSVTHPEVAEGISTMTNRYLQSMVSKCLVVGVLPDEMKRLFDYNPVVELDQKYPAEHLLEILDNFDSYGELIERNYKTVIEHHTWGTRWDTISAIINGQRKTGYE
jgi:hypothetical protein